MRPHAVDGPIDHPRDVAVAFPGTGTNTPRISASRLFSLVWEALADIMGTAAGATLLRRSALRALPRWPELAALAITRENLEYRYTVPSAWETPALEVSPALRSLVRELCVLLVDMTGPVVVGRLARVPELRDRGLVPLAEEKR